MPATKPIFTLSENFDASGDVLWRAWTDGDELQKWFGPLGSSLPHCKMDFRVGGSFFYELKFQGGTHYGLWKFLEIEQPKTLGLLQSFADAQGQPIRHPWNDKWPLVMYSSTKFTQQGDKTNITLRWSPHEALPHEEAEFANGMESMTQGWAGTIESLRNYLAKK